VLAGVAGEEHSIGLLLLAHILQEAGFVVSDLGADVPADDLVRFAAKTEARLVALAASTAAREETIRDAVAALQALPDAPAIIVGGRIAELVDLEGLGVEWVGSSLVEASRVARALAGRLSRPAEG
jgi:methanogenic corrinoid protein MtbC1